MLLFQYALKLISGYMFLCGKIALIDTKASRFACRAVIGIRHATNLSPSMINIFFVRLE